MVQLVGKARESWTSLNLGLGNEEVVQLVENFPECPLLKDFTLEWQTRTMKTLQNDLSLHQEMYTKLDHVLLRFSQTTIICTFYRFSPPINSISFWFNEIRKHLPMLSQRRAVTLYSLHDEGEFHDVSPPRVILKTTTFTSP